MRIEAQEIEAIEVATYRAGLEVAHYEEPRTPAEGRFSLKYVVATALTHGSVRLAAFSPERLQCEKTRALMRKTSVSIDPELEAAFPAKRAARVAIRARGRREEWLQPTRIGDPDAPLSDRALEEKYFELATPVIGEAKAREVLARLWRLE
jgi:2-methylcitrate dehydratase PrpD